MSARPAWDPEVKPVLAVRGLHAVFDTEAGTVRAVDGVSFEVRPGEVVAMVGESGCGKTATALAVMGLLPEPGGRIEAGEVVFRGEDLVTAGAEERRRVRGEGIAMIFQDPLAALNPVHRVGKQVAEVIRAHRVVTRAEAWDRAVELLTLVGIPNAEERAHDYPHQFSGGMRQRVMIAMAIALNPEVLIADEPTTALDVTIQAQILDALLDVRDRFGTAVLLITHDLGIVADLADRVMVMYAGRIVEEADVATTFREPKHPYTWGLLASTTRIDHPRAERLAQIPGAPPSLLAPPPGCRFAPRCAWARDRCKAEDPALRALERRRHGAGPAHEAACHFAADDGWGPEAPRVREILS